MFRPSEEDSCCYTLTLNNYHDANTYYGIQVCGLSPGIVLNLNNNIGSGWTTVNINASDFTLAYDAGTIPLGQFSIPEFCVATSSLAANNIEVKWLGFVIDGYVVLCRDSLEVLCPDDCGYFTVNDISCSDVTGGGFNMQLTFHNTNVDTIYSAALFFTNTGLSAYNQVITFVGGVPPGGSYGPINVFVGPPAQTGDSICLVTTLHNQANNTSTSCCQFKTIIVTPPCDQEVECKCDEAFEHEVYLGINCVINGNTVTFTPIGQMTSCDKLFWDFLDEQVSVMSVGNNPVIHTFPGKGEYQVCITFLRTTPDGKQCKFKIFKDVRIKTPLDFNVSPNPAKDYLNISLTGLTKEREVQTVSIINSKGVPVLKRNDFADENGRLKLELGNLISGLYFIKIESAGEVAYKKFIIAE